MASFLKRAAQLTTREDKEEEKPPLFTEPISPERLSEIRCHHWKQIGLRALALLRYAYLQRSVSACLRIEPEDLNPEKHSTKPLGEQLAPSKSDRTMGFDPATCDHPMVFEGKTTRIGGAGGGKSWQTCLKCGSRWTLLPEERGYLLKGKPAPKNSEKVPQVQPCIGKERQMSPFYQATEKAALQDLCLEHGLAFKTNETISELQMKLQLFHQTSAASSISTRVPAEANSTDEKKEAGSRDDDLREAVGTMSMTMQNLISRLAKKGVFDSDDDGEEVDAVMVEEVGPQKRRARLSQA